MDILWLNHHQHKIVFSNRDGGAASCPDGDCECASCIASMVSISLSISSILNYNIMNIKQLWWKQGKQKLRKSNLNNNAGDKKRAYLLPEVLRPKQVCLTKSHMFCENIVKKCEKIVKTLYAANVSMNCIDDIIVLQQKITYSL